MLENTESLNELTRVSEEDIIRDKIKNDLDAMYRKFIHIRESCDKRWYTHDIRVDDIILINHHDVTVKKIFDEEYKKIEIKFYEIGETKVICNFYGRPNHGNIRFRMITKL